MKHKSSILISVMGILVGMLITGPVLAAEILTEEDFSKKIVVEENFIKTADNFIILLDSSKSMNDRWKKGSKKTKLEVAKEILRSREALLPDLGYNAGLYSFSPFTEHYPMGPFDKARYAQAIDNLPANAGGNTFLPRALRKLEPVLKGLSGKTVVFVINDGTYSQVGGMREPEDLTEELAGKYNVCFYMIGDTRTNRARKRLVDMAKANACSRVVSFANFIENPQYITGALYVVKSTEVVQTTSKTKIVGLKTNDVLFDFKKSDIRPDFNEEIDALGTFMQQNPAAFVMLVGYADNIGSEEYNLVLSQRRAENVAAYLADNFSVAQDRIVLNWYGETNPVAANDTEEGRGLNRRVEIAVGGLK